jgi:hypothetical protein
MSACQVVMLSIRNSRSRISSGSSKAPWMRALSVMRVGSNKPPSGGDTPWPSRERISLTRSCCSSIHEGSREGFMASNHSRATLEWAKLATSSSRRLHSSASQLHSSTIDGTGSSRLTRPCYRLSREPLLTLHDRRSLRGAGVETTKVSAVRPEHSPVTTLPLTNAGVPHICLLLAVVGFREPRP